MQDLPLSKKKQAGNRRVDYKQFRQEIEKEKNIQFKAEELLDIHRIKYLRIDDKVYNAFRYMPNKEALIYKNIISRHLKGVPDLIIFCKGEFPFNRCLFVEFKKKGNKLTQGQINYSKGFYLHVFYSFEDFEKFILDHI